MRASASGCSGMTQEDTPELTIALLSESQTDIGVRAWPDIATRNAAGLRVAAMLRGERLTLANVGSLAAALGLDCDDLTSTETDAARAALETQT